MSKKVLFIETRREGYSIDQINETITAGEMIAMLSQLPEDTEIYLDNDNGYTYGGITGWNMDVKYRVTCPECGEEMIFDEDDDFECECGQDLYRMIL